MIKSSRKSCRTKTLRQRDIPEAEARDFTNYSWAENLTQQLMRGKLKICDYIRR